jgi:MFS family permease
VDDRALTGVLVGGCFAAIAVGQFAGRVIAPAVRLPLACAALVAAESLQAVSLAFGRVSLLVAGATVAGLGIGLALGHGLACINTDCPPHRRGEANSTFFAVMYAGLCLPVIGAGVLIERIGLRAGGEIFSAGVAAVAVVVGTVQLLAGSRERRTGPPPEDPGQLKTRSSHSRQPSLGSPASSGPPSGATPNR